MSAVRKRVGVLGARGRVGQAVCAALSATHDLCLVAALGRGLHRPRLRDAIPADVQEAGSGRRQQPLVEAGAVVIAAEVARLVRKVRKGVRTVDDRLDAAAPGLVAHLLYREDLSGEVRDVTEVEHFRGG